MAVTRFIVLIVTIVAISIAPLMWGLADVPHLVGTANASTPTGLSSDGTSVRQDNDDDDDDDDNDDDDDDDDDNDEDDDNDNDEDDGDDNDNADDDDDVPAAAPAPAPQSTTGGEVFPAARCYDAGMVSAINLGLTDGVVTLTVVPASSFPQASEVSLSAVDPASVSAPSGAVLGNLIWDVQALRGCDGPELGQLPSAVNLGIAYSAPADKSDLQIARWNGSTWVDVVTVPDPSPSNPYISATILETGVYTVYQKP